MQQVQFRFIDESFNYQGRQLRVARSAKGCDGCYFNQKQMPCDEQDQHLLGACSADQRADGEETILVLDGQHLRVTAPSINLALLPNPAEHSMEQYFHCLPGSVHKVTRSDGGTLFIADSLGKDDIPLPEGCYELLRVRATANTTGARKGDELVYIGSDGATVTALDSDGHQLSLPAKDVVYIG